MPKPTQKVQVNISYNKDINAIEMVIMYDGKGVAILLNETTADELIAQVETAQADFEKNNSKH